MKFLVFIFLCVMPLFVSADNTCKVFFNENLSSLETEYVAPVDSHWTSYGEVVVYRIKKTLNQIDENQRIDPHGSVYTITKAIGINEAQAWGIEFYKKPSFIPEQVWFTFPSIEFLNRRITLLNFNNGREFIPFRFKLSPTDGLISSKSFVTNHGNRIIEIGKSGWIRKHDEFYHAMSAMLIPKQAHEFAQSLSFIILAFEKYLIQRNLLTESLQSLIHKVYDKRAKELDYSGNLIAFIAEGYDPNSEVFNRNLNQNASKIKEVLTTYTQNNLSPLDYLKESLIKHNNQLVNERFLLKYLADFKDSLVDASAFEVVPGELSDEEMIRMILENLKKFKEKSLVLQYKEPYRSLL